MRVSKILATIMITFLITTNINVSTVQAATVIDGGPAGCFVHSSSYDDIKSANKIVADTSNPGLGQITSITLKGYAANSSLRVEYDGWVEPIMLYSSETTINTTITPQGSTSLASLQLYPNGEDNYIYISSFSATNAVGDQFVVNYSPPTDYIEPGGTPPQEEATTTV